MRREGSGTGTGTRVSPRLTSLLFLLGEERYRQPRAVYKYWVGDLPSCDHAATCFSSSSSFMAGMDQKGRCSGTYKSGIVGHYAPRAVFFPGLAGPECSAFWPVRTSRTVMRFFLARLLLLVTVQPRAVFSSLVGRPRVLGILAGMEQKDSCPRRTGYWFLWEMTSVGFCIQRSAWFDSGYMRCVSLRGFWKNFGVVQTVQKTVKVPHAFLGHGC